MLLCVVVHTGTVQVCAYFLHTTPNPFHPPPHSPPAFHPPPILLPIPPPPPHTSSSPTSQLYCSHFSSWDHSKDWTIPMPSKENIVCIAVGLGWIAVATNKQTLRLFTVGGLQKEVISVPGRVVTIGGHGDRLVVVYHFGPSKK